MNESKNNQPVKNNNKMNNTHTQKQQQQQQTNKKPGKENAWLNSIECNYVPEFKQFNRTK